MDKNIGRAVKRFRLTKGIKQNELAERLSIPVSTLANYETGRRPISVELLQEISRELNIKVQDLIGENDTLGIEVGEPKTKSIFELMQANKVIDKPLFDRISSEVIELHKNGLIEDYIVTMSAEEFSVFVVDDSGSGAGLRGKFNGKYNDRGGFFDFLEEMREDLDE